MKTRLNNIKPMKDFRKKLRNSGTSAEATLWIYLQKKKLGKKFRRQHSIGYYVLDFYCPEEKLAVELDGAHHFTPAGMDHDEKRTAYLNEHGIRVIRFENNEVFYSLEAVLQAIKSNFVRS